MSNRAVDGYGLIDLNFFRQGFSKFFTEQFRATFAHELPVSVCICRFCSVQHRVLDRWCLELLQYYLRGKQFAPPILTDVVLVARPLIRLLFVFPVL